MTAQAQHKITPRGIRNNNPGNIEYHPANRWRGQMDYNPGVEERFCRFTLPFWGLRALAVLLNNYYRRYGLNTVNKLITRFAPRNENNTRAYVCAVSGALGVKPDEPLVVSRATLCSLLEAIVQHENGQQPYPRELIAEAVEAAL